MIPTDWWIIPRNNWGLFLSIIVLEGFAKDLVRHQYYALDALVILPGSNYTTKTLCALNSSDVGHCIVVVVYLMMTRMRLFTVNSRKTP